MSRPLESRTVTGNMTSVVSTETTSPGLTSCSGCFFSVGTAGGGPIVSMDVAGAGVAVGFGLAMGRRWTPFRCALVTENKSAAQTSSAKKRIAGFIVILPQINTDETDRHLSVSSV